MRKLPDYIRSKVDEWNDLNLNRKGMFVPLEVEITFKVGRNGNSFLSFDAFILHHIFLYVLGEHRFNISLDFDEYLYPKIPIKKQFYGDMSKDYFYLCGGFFDISNKVCFMTKRTDEPVLHIVKDKRIRLNAGSMKNYKLPVLYSDKKKYKFNMIADYELIKKIIYNKNLNIGKKSAIGYGQCEINIKESKDFNLINSNKYIRPVPMDFINKNKLQTPNETFVCPVRPPYFGINAKYEECGI